jgi:hypothetical protein
VFRALVRLPDWLSWLLSVIEPLTVLAATYLMCYVAYWVVFTGGQWHTHLVMTIRELNDNWKAGIIILIVLFYRTIRAFLERVEEFWGMKAPRPPVATTAGTNPEIRLTEEDAADQES